MVALHSVRCRIRAVHSQPRSNAIRPCVCTGISVLRHGCIRGVQQHHAKNNRDNRNPQMHNKRRSHQRPNRGGNLQKHSHPHIGISLANVRRSRPAGRRNHRNQRRPNRIVNVHMEHHRKQRHNHHAPAKPGKRAQESREQRPHPNQSCKFQCIQGDKRFRAIRALHLNSVRINET